ncbi:MAG TPA: glycosyltransferase family 2 protein [Syntrophales bacterium]|nr:glycosyltransferase family 2 protein [Syntrophales bacterium]
MNKPKVSIITPTFNRAALIEKTIKSVLSQTYDDLDYIVVDGCSNDGTVEILEKYARQGKLRYISEPDKGMYDAINKGLRIATGEILAYLNSDDMYFPWTVSTAVDALISKNADLVCGDTLVQTIDGKTIRINLWPKVTLAYLKTGHYIAQPTVFMKRNVFLALGEFGCEVKLLGDCEYWLKAVEAGYRIENLHELLAIECNHGETLRLSLRQQIEDEKTILRARYKPAFNNNALISFYAGMKFVEREMVYLAFKILLFQEAGNVPAWKNFRKSYLCGFNLLNYYLSKAKIANLYDSIWRVEESPTSFDCPVQATSNARSISENGKA